MVERMEGNTLTICRILGRGTSSVQLYLKNEGGRLKKLNCHEARKKTWTHFSSEGGTPDRRERNRFYIEQSRRLLSLKLTKRTRVKGGRTPSDERAKRKQKVLQIHTAVEKRAKESKGLLTLKVREGEGLLTKTEEKAMSKEGRGRKGLRLVKNRHKGGNPNRCFTRFTQRVLSLAGGRPRKIRASVGRKSEKQTKEEGREGDSHNARRQRRRPSAVIP